jgi:hypothetical protein
MSLCAGRKVDMLLLFTTVLVYHHEPPLLCAQRDHLVSTLCACSLYTDLLTY